MHLPNMLRVETFNTFDNEKKVSNTAQRHLGSNQCLCYVFSQPLFSLWRVKAVCLPGM